MNLPAVIDALERISDLASAQVRVIDDLLNTMARPDVEMIPGRDDLSEPNIFADCPRPLAVNQTDGE